MGFDLHSTDPENPTYFRTNAWHWRPIAIYCESVAPELTDYSRWHYNDGAGLDKSKALNLAAILQHHMDSGRTAIFQQEYVDKQIAMPDEPCGLCYGTGQRDDNHYQGTCTSCEGRGTRRPIETWYPFDITAIAEFIQFLRNCGGFQIW